ncbi:hypothetical protein ABT340_15570 [Streptosporangium sp. NPDC000239]|uniref:hypothetical protein n=1 Tax=Streptosporangium sp. NPDC000239 TaxID=3154248 RepID=UPI00331EFEE7
MSFYDEDPWAAEAPTDNPWATDTPAADPWASEPPADEAQAAPNTTPTTPSKESTITANNSTEGKIVTTIKYGNGFDAPWTVIHSNSVEEATATLNEAKGLLELTARVAKFAKGLDSGTSATAPRGGGSTTTQRPASTPPGQEVKTCSHGEMKYITGNGAKGPWAGHFCPLEKGNPDQCKAIFVRNR